VSSSFGDDPRSGALYVFCNRRHTLMLREKIDLIIRRLLGPQSENPDAAQLGLLLKRMQRWHISLRFLPKSTMGKAVSYALTEMGVTEGLSQRARNRHRQ
jgi:hypothetical protein